ncbi:MAG: ABC transporter permease [Actinobacteria bacterium]|nr:ABC transporter permease [Actinomycetota bacterium]
MGGYLVKRLAALIPVLLVVGIVVFTLVHLAPGDPAAIILGPDADPGDVARLHRQMGLDQPILRQFLNWSSRALVGDLGESVFLRKPVTGALAERLGPTLSLAVLAEAIAVLIAIPAGVVAAWRRGRWPDYIVMVFALLGISMPSFWLGLNAILLFAVQWHLLPVAGYTPITQGFVKWLRYLTLPALTLGMVHAGLIARMVRTAMMDVIQEDFVRTARAKGLSQFAILLKHVLRNALVPVVTVLGMSFGLLIGGSIVVETVFTIPGIGQLIINSVQRRDYPLIQGAVLLIALVYVTLNLLVDVLYGALDPRIRYQ